VRQDGRFRRGAAEGEPAAHAGVDPAIVAGRSSPVRRGERIMGFGHHLRGLREAARLSRAELARRAGISASTLRSWEGDRGFPGVRAGLRLAEALGVTLERLAEGVEDTADDEALAAVEESRRRPKGKAR
jgi:DNA-binding XRE family transcriptional regulator